MLHRRTLLTTGLAFTLLSGAMPLQTALGVSGSRRKLLFIIQRGGADGLVELAPTGDPDFPRLRKAFLDEAQSGFALDDLFRLHPSLSNIANLYERGDAAFIHATASAYRDRSHFEGQNVLETGGDTPYEIKTGWLNRLVSLLQSAGSQPASSAIALANHIPAALRGPAEATSYTPSHLPEPGEDFLGRLDRLYSDSPNLAEALQSGNATREIAGNAKPVRGRDGKAIGALMARLMARDNGADIAMLETDGWDTHANALGRLRRNLTLFDDIVAAYREGMADNWGDVLVIVATEFGRSVAINGTMGTDHGTGGVMMLLGGAVNGGKVVTDWPGLGPSQLLDGRDLRPTISQECAISGAVAAHFGLDPVQRQNALFAHMTGHKPVTDLVKA